MANKNRGRPSPSFDRRRTKSDWQPKTGAESGAQFRDKAKSPKDKPHRQRDPGITRQSGADILFGTHAVKAALLNPRRKCLRLWCLPGARATLDPLLDEVAAAGRAIPPTAIVERHDLDHLTHEAVHQGLALEVQPLPELDLDELIDGSPVGDILVILDQVTDPHNIGAVARSAAAFGARAIIQTERHAPGHTGVLAKTASGGLEEVALVRVVNLARAMRELREAGYKIIGFDERGVQTLAQSGFADDAKQNLVLALGAEGEGLRRLTRENCDEIVRLPTAGPVASLNVSNAAAIALYETVRTRR